ncbi:MAG: hypothetical protein ACFFFB_24210 [Candidatus Heimdallarchaeota archaeon]
MQDDKKFRKLKVILILIFIFLCIPVTFLYLFLRDVSYLSFFFNDYIGSGNSLFIPFLPKVNLFWYLPEPFCIIPFNLGLLIDIIILINIIGYIQTTIYHYFVKRVYLNEITPILYFDLRVLNSTEQTYLLIQDPENRFRFDERVNNLITNHEIDIEDNHTKLKLSKMFKGEIFSKFFSFNLFKRSKFFENPVKNLFLKTLRISSLVINYFIKSYKNLILTNIFKGRGAKN